MEPFSDKVQAGVEKLRAIIPAKERQIEVGEKLGSLHKAILRTFAEKGRPMEDLEIEKIVGRGNAASALRSLQAKDLAVLDADGKLVGSYPMTMENTDHYVAVNGNFINAMCALDALGISQMFDTKVRIESKCHVTHADIVIEQDGERILTAKPSEDVCFGIVWNSPTACCAHSLCTKMVYLKDGKTARQWASESPQREVYTLKEAVEFSGKLFVPLMK